MTDGNNSNSQNVLRLRFQLRFISKKVHFYFFCKLVDAIGTVLLGGIFYELYIFRPNSNKRIVLKNRY